MPVDIKTIIKIITRSLDRGHINLHNTHEQIVTNTVYNKAVNDVVSLLQGIDNGTIDSETIKNLMQD